MEAIRVRHALDSASDIGPVVDERQLEANFSDLDIGRQEVATLFIGGQRLTRETPRFYLQPARFTDVHPKMRIEKKRYSVRSP